MEEAQPDIGNGDKEWRAVASHLSLSQLDHLERVHIECVGSTDFVLGRQTNFNGPVTIINCQDVLKRACHVPEEEVVIREKVLSHSAAARIHHMATTSQQNVDEPTPGKLRRRTPLILTLIFVVAVVAAPTFLTMSSTKDEPVTSNCTRLTDDICLYSHFHWRGRPTTQRVMPLRLPVQYLVISPTHSHDYCYDYEECVRVVGQIQVNGTVAACNFLLGGEGNVYEGLGWEVASALGGPLSQRLLRVCFLGDYETNWPTYPLMEAFKVFAEFGVMRKYVAEDYVLMGWQLSALLYKIVSKWPRFCNESDGAGCQGSGSESLPDDKSVIRVGPRQSE